MKSPVRFSLYAAAAAAVFPTFGAEASALEVTSTSVDDEGGLRAEFVDDVSPKTQVNYTVSTTASALYVCVDKQFEPLPEARFRAATETLIEEHAPFTSTPGGRVTGVLAVGPPRERLGFTCPIRASGKLAEVKYVQIRVQRENGPIALGEDQSKVLIRF
ncbi:hypothetical protein [Sorangium sp. So ce1099]|uniref:hypothetical protein n=1 Tax=Sorangium sp. So ce1099 TaxID=3133331 RepID=UPI003F606B3D